MQKLTVSKCCASPLLVRGGDEGTKWMTCASCKNPADQMTYPFSTVGEMTAWLKKRKTYRGMAFTAGPTWSVGDRKEYPITKKPMRISSLVAFLVGCAIGIALFFAFSARASGYDGWWDAGDGVSIRSFQDMDDGLVCWVAQTDWAVYGGSSVSVSCQPAK